MGVLLSSGFRIEVHRTKSSSPAASSGRLVRGCGGPCGEGAHARRSGPARRGQAPPGPRAGSSAAPGRGSAGGEASARGRAGWIGRGERTEGRGGGGGGVHGSLGAGGCGPQRPALPVRCVLLRCHRSRRSKRGWPPPLLVGQCRWRQRRSATDSERSRGCCPRCPWTTRSGRRRVWQARLVPRRTRTVDDARKGSPRARYRPGPCLTK